MRKLWKVVQNLTLPMFCGCVQGVPCFSLFAICSYVFLSLSSLFICAPQRKIVALRGWSRAFSHSLNKCWETLQRSASMINAHKSHGRGELLPPESCCPSGSGGITIARERYLCVCVCVPNIMRPLAYSASELPVMMMSWKTARFSFVRFFGVLLCKGQRRHALEPCSATCRTVKPRRGLLQSQDHLGKPDEVCLLSVPVGTNRG